MKSVLTLILNPAIPFPKLANAVGHVCLGLGKNVRDLSALQIAVRFAAAPNMMFVARNFFTGTEEGNLLPNRVIDFTSSMTGETYVQQLERTAATSTDELEYFVVAGLTTSDFAEKILNNCDFLCEYMNHDVKVGDPTVMQSLDKLPDTNDGVGLSIVLDKKSSAQDVLLGIAVSSLTMGANIPEELLKLLAYKDKDEVQHSDISAHSYVMLQAKNSNQLLTLADEVTGQDSELVSYVNPTPQAVCLFGFTDTRREQTKKYSMLSDREMPLPKFSI